MVAGRAPAGVASGVDGALVGRDDLLTELVAAARETVAGSGSLVLLEGEAGIGKTSVARALARAMRDELDVSWGSCSPDRSAPPFWPWRGIVDVGESSGDEAGAAIGAARFELLASCSDDLVRRARAAPLLHVIEDLQWADVASVLLLAHLGGSVVDAPLMVVATLRTGEPLGPALDEAVEEVRRSALVRAVSPLSDEDIGRLIRVAGLGRDDELRSLVSERTGGNPLFVTELLRAVGAAEPAERVHALVGGDVPTRVSEVVARQLDRLPDAVSDLVRSASVIGSEGADRTLAGMQGSSVDSVLDLAAQARAARLLEAAPPGRWRFRHELVRDAVHAGMTDASRARRHAAVLEVLAADPSTPPAVLAHHALAAQPLFDAERAVALAARAGGTALAHLAFEEAVGWFERALDTAPADLGARWRADLLVQCGEAHRHLGEIDDARRAFAAAADLSDDPGLLARAALGYADPGADLGIAYRTGDPRTGELFERAIRSQPEGDGVTTVLLESRSAADLYFSETPERARTLADAALERAHRSGDRRALVVASAVVHDAYVVGQSDLAEQLRGSDQLVEWAVEDGSPAALLTAHRARVLDLLAAGDLAAMDAAIVAFRRVAEPLGEPAYLWWPALWSAMRALLEGKHDLAEQRATAAYGIGERPFPELAWGNLSFLLFFLRREQGRLAELEQPTRDHAASHADIPAIRVALALLLAELGRADEAGGMLSALSGRDLDRLHDRNWPASWFQLAGGVDRG